MPERATEKPGMGGVMTELWHATSLTPQISSLQGTNRILAKIQGLFKFNGEGICGQWQDMGKVSLVYGVFSRRPSKYGH